MKRRLNESKLSRYSAEACSGNPRDSRLNSALGDAIFPFVNDRCRLQQLISLRTTLYCRFHEEDKVVIQEIQLMLHLTLVQKLLSKEATKSGMLVVAGSKHGNLNFRVLSPQTLAFQTNSVPLLQQLNSVPPLFFTLHTRYITSGMHRPFTNGKLAAETHTPSIPSTSTSQFLFF